MKKCGFTFILLFFVFCLSIDASGQGGLILPMPGQKQPTPNTPSPQNHSNLNNNKDHKAPSNTYNESVSKGKIQRNNQKPSPSDSKNAIANPSGMIIPMPKTSKSNSSGTGKPAKRQEEPPTQLPAAQSLDLGKEPLITIPIQPANKSRNQDPATVANSSEDLSNFFNDDNPPIPPNEVSATAEPSLDALLDSTTQTEAKVSSNDGSTVTVFPKDTGSAIFMVMKSWKCDNYDCVKLLEQALDVYSKESGDDFKINGYENLPKGLTISIDEEDITIDEMLDIMSSKTERDWGADVASKIIYIYPQGIKTESYVSW